MSFGRSLTGSLVTLLMTALLASQAYGTPRGHSRLAATRRDVPRDRSRAVERLFRLLPLHFPRTKTGAAMTFKLSAFAIGVLLSLSACSSAPVALPTHGHVYYAHIKDGAVQLTRASGVLVLAERVNVCDKGLLGEASTTGIDAHLSRTDAEGLYAIPALTFNEVCSHAVLEPTAYVPDFKSYSARALLIGFGKQWTALRGQLTEDDAILMARPVTDDNVSEVARELYASMTSYTVKTGMIRVILHEMAPQFRKVTDWSEQCRKYFVCDDAGKQAN